MAEASSRNLVGASSGAVDLRPISSVVPGASAPVVGVGGSGVAATTGHAVQHAYADDLEELRERSAVESSRPRMYRWPKWRVALAVFLFALGFALCIAAIVNMSLAFGIAGGLVLLPGVYMSFVYLQLWRGHPMFRKEDWLIRIDDEEDEGY